MTKILAAEHLGKRYRVRKERSVVLGLVRRQPASAWWALRDASFAVAPGEVLAVIGRNGAGKSTLLKIAAGVTHPTTGHLLRPRRIAPLIEVGAGFHPEMTGRENVMINGRILGLRPAEVRERFDEIVEFAELGHAIDQQIREYSSGMFVRLGFAVAVHTNPTLLVVDEVLAVGDLPFQARCLDRIQQMRDDGVGVLFVSHNLAAVQNIADRGLLLEHGETLAQGPVAEVIGAYHDLLDRTGREREGIHDEAGSTGELELVHLRAVDDSGQHRLTWEPGEPATLEARVRATRDVPAGAIAGFNLAKEGAGLVAHWMGRDPAFHLPALAAGEELSLRFDVRLNVGEGGYWLSLSIARPDWSALMLAQRDGLRLGITARGAAGGIVDLDTRFSVVVGD